MLHIGNYSQTSKSRYGISKGSTSHLKLKSVESTIGHSDISKTFNAMYYTFDPTFTTVLFSLYARDERLGFSIVPDVFTYSPSGHALDILPYVQSIGFEIYSIGEHCAKFFSQVRVGSVIFLVGVGSLVCWRLWNYWNETKDDPDGDNGPPNDQTTSKKGRRKFFATFLEEEFVQNDFEEDDPTLFQGRYFGPESPVECATPSYSDYSPASNASSRINTSQPSSNLYHADNSDFCEYVYPSESEVENIPFDAFEITSDSKKESGCLKKTRRKSKSSAKIIQSSSSSSSASPYNIPQSAYRGRCSEDVPDSSGYLSRSTFDRKFNLDDRQKLESKHMHDNLDRFNIRKRPDSLQIPNKAGRSRREKNLREDIMNMKLKQYFANYDSDDDWLRNNEEELLSDEEVKDNYRRNSREHSLSNLMEKMKQRSSRRKGSIELWKNQLSTNNSISSNLSDILVSPAGHNLRLRREESVTSNMSDFAPSECSEFSIDFSNNDDFFSNNALSCFVDIENELNFVKSSVFEIDEEFFRYASRPNPYLLKTTYTENSYESNGSRPDSSLMEDLVHFDSRRRRSEISVDLLEKIKPQNSSSNSTAENSLEWDSPQHGWSSINNNKRHRRSVSVGGLPRSHSQEIAPSLEWDNGYLKKYEDEMERISTKNKLDWQLFLPDHASLELDMEEELSTPSSYATFSQLNLLELQPSNLNEYENNSRALPPGATAILMTASVDSAIYSNSGSRSGSISPSSQILSQSMMSSGIATSYSEPSPDRETVTYSENPLAKRRRSFNPESELEPVDEITEITESKKVKKSVFYIPEDFENEEKKLENIENNNVMGNKNSFILHNTKSSKKLEAVGRKIDIKNYATSEWSGETEKALTIINGYEQIPTKLNFHNIRRIRGDNYCGIRAVLFQMISASVPLPNCQQVYAKLMFYLHKGHNWIRKYSFGDRIPHTEDKILNEICECLSALDKMVQLIGSVENKETILLNSLNSDSSLDVKLCEGIKLLLLQTSIELYEGSSDDDDASLLSAILFARETSTNPQEFLLNHLNSVGNSAGLEQIEMILLGFALHVTIAVVRPSYSDKEDYICFFPESHVDEWPKIYLVAEDDRHYNILSS